MYINKGEVRTFFGHMFVHPINDSATELEQCKPTSSNWICASKTSICV